MFSTMPLMVHRPLARSDEKLTLSSSEQVAGMHEPAPSRAPAAFALAVSSGSANTATRTERPVPCGRVAVPLTA